MAALQRGERAAFAYLYDNYSAALYGVLKRIVRDDELAQDLLQEAFVRIWRNVPRYDAAKGRLFTWLLNLTRNLAIDHLRSRRYADAQRTDGLEGVRTPGAGEGSILALPDVALLRTRIAQLRSEHRQPLELVYFEGYTQAEAAEALELPLGTLKTRIRTALQQLRGEFGD